MRLELHRARSVPEAVRVLSEAAGEAMLVGGGVGVGLMLRQGFALPTTLVSLSDVGGLDGIEVSNGSLRIGGLATLQQIASSSVVRAHAPALADACASVGNVRVRNVATLAGNLAQADYASDPPAVLACLDASCTVEGPSGQRAVALSDLITGFYETSLSEGDVITRILVPLGRPGERGIYLRYCSRSSEDRPCVGVAARAWLDDGLIRQLHVVVGAVSSIPSSVPEVTAAAAGRPLDDATIAQVARGCAGSIEPIADVRGSTWYRKQMIGVFVGRALRALRPVS